MQYLRGKAQENPSRGDRPSLQFPGLAVPQSPALTELPAFLPSFLLPTHSFVLVQVPVQSVCTGYPQKTPSYPLAPNKRKVSSSKNVLTPAEAKSKQGVNDLRDGWGVMK